VELCDRSGVRGGPGIYDEEEVMKYLKVTAIAGGLAAAVLVLCAAAEATEYRAYFPLIVKPDRPLGVASDWNVHGRAALPETPWFYNWGYTGTHDGFAVEGWNDRKFVPMVWGKGANLDSVAATAQAHPGRVWLIYNEPDLPEQANIPPEVAAQDYALLYDAIKGADPAAKLYCCGEAWAKHAWMEEFLTYVERPIDGVHIHGYPMKDGSYWPHRMNANLATNNLDAFYEWCQLQPELAGKPVWITEVGVLSWYCTIDTPEKIRDQFMLPFMAWFKTSPYERAAWFSDYSWSTCGNLVNTDGSLTVVGDTWGVD